jgi:hypothetical protein
MSFQHPVVVKKSCPAKKSYQQLTLEFISRCQNVEKGNVRYGLF